MPIGTKELRNRAKGERTWLTPWLCQTVGVELWRGKGLNVGGGVVGGDRREHAGSLLKCQESLQWGSGESRGIAAACRKFDQPLENGFKLKSLSLFDQTFWTIRMSSCFWKRQIMDSDSDSPFNYSWPSFPKMRMHRKKGKKGNSECGTLINVSVFIVSIMSHWEFFLARNVKPCKVFFFYFAVIFQEYSYT